MQRGRTLESGATKPPGSASEGLSYQDQAARPAPVPRGFRRRVVKTRTSSHFWLCSLWPYNPNPLQSGIREPTSSEAWVVSQPGTPGCALARAENAARIKSIYRPLQAEALGYGCLQRWKRWGPSGHRPSTRLPRHP